MGANVTSGCDVVKWPEWQAFAKRLGVIEHPMDMEIKITFGEGGLSTIEHKYRAIEGTGKLLSLEDNHA